MVIKMQKTYQEKTVNPGAYRHPKSSAEAEAVRSADAYFAGQTKKDPFGYLELSRLVSLTVGQVYDTNGLSLEGQHQVQGLAQAFALRAVIEQMQKQGKKLHEIDLKELADLDLTEKIIAL